MKRAFFSKPFIFNEIHSGKFRHTDQSTGSPLNYLALLLEGKCKIVSKNKTIEINAGEAFFIPINLSYHSYWHDARFLSFGFKALNTDECSDMELQVIPCDKSTIEKIAAIPTEHPVSAKSLAFFYNAIADVLLVMERSSLSKDALTIKNAQKYIDENPGASIPQIAKHCALGESHLYYLFKKVTGITPNEYRQKVLCERGTTLLGATDKTIEEISEILGISSGSYFRKLLKKHTGLTPREIRKTGLL